MLSVDLSLLRFAESKDMQAAALSLWMFQHAVT